MGMAATGEMHPMGKPQHVSTLLWKCWDTMKTNEPIYTICKYSPLELLSGFGLKAERLDPNPASFSCAESCGHPNLCGYGKAVLEEVLTRNIRCLLLVDCCDVCRRIYDILLNRGGMEFLYLLPLPHKNGPG